MGLLLEVTEELDGRFLRSYQSHMKYGSFYLELSGILALFRASQFDGEFDGILTTDL
jgi:hypothetical protein